MSKACDFSALLVLALPLTPHVIEKSSTAPIRNKADILIQLPVQPLTAGLRITQEEEELWMDPTKQTTASHGGS